MIFDTLTPHLISLSEEVGKMIMSYYKSNLNVETKADKTPLTLVDQKAHQMITQALAILTPGVPILSEESETIDFTTRSSWNEYWLIDPLDGTRDFINQTGEFCICIAYIKNNRPIYGLIYAPYSQTHYFTNDQQKSFKYQDNKATLLQCASPKQPLEIVIGNHSHNNQQLQSYLHDFGDTKISHLGSALKFCKIAEGIFDHYPRFGPCSEWDTAAGGCILEAAGGRVVGEDKKPLRYNTQHSLISPIFFASGKA